MGPGLWVAVPGQHCRPCFDPASQGHPLKHRPCLKPYLALLHTVWGERGPVLWVPSGKVLKSLGALKQPYRILENVNVAAEEK